MQNTTIKKVITRTYALISAVMTKISLFFKPIIMKACFSFVIILSIILLPIKAHAGFLSFMGDLLGTQTSAAEVTPVESNTKNSQTMTLLEPSITPELKNTISQDSVAIIKDQVLESTNGPLGTEADLGYEAYTSTSKLGVHIVKAGETLASIAKKEKVSTYAIVYANSDIKRSDLTKVGTALTIIPLDGSAYTVKRGETASSIAQKYGLSVNDILEYNVLSKASDIDAGETICLVGTSKAEIEKANRLAIEKDKIAKQAKIKPTEESSPEKTPVVVSAPVESPVVQAVVPVVNKTEDVAQGPSGAIAKGFIWPFPAGVGRVTQRLHGPNGVDLGAPKGTPIYAVADGTILIADGNGWNGGYGYYVVENFNDGTQGMYAHMSKVVADAGSPVKQGDLIGYVGSTGRSTGPHLHFERRGDENPFKDLKVNSTSDDFHD